MCFKDARATRAREMRRSPAKIANCIIGEQEISKGYINFHGYVYISTTKVLNFLYKEKDCVYM